MSVKFFFADIFLFFGGIMNSRIRLESKYLLSKNNLRLFLISMLSASLRWGNFALNLTGLYLLLNSKFLENLLSSYNNALVYTGVVIFYLIIFFFTAMTASAIKLGEQFIYFTRAQRAKGQIRLLFKFLHPKKSFKALRFYLTVNFMKVFWLIYFLSPVGVCAGCTAYLYNISYLSPEVYYVLAFGTTLLLSISIVVWRVAVLRYSAAPYYICLKPELQIKDAIKKSIRFTDGFLTDGVLLEYSLSGWILSCILIIPLFYVVPYIKLTKSVFVTNTVFSHSRTPQSRYSVNLLNLLQSSQHIN